MGSKLDISKDKLMEALEKHNGVINKARKELHISNGSIYTLIEKYELREWIDALKQRIKDLAIGVVTEGLEGNPDLAIKYLSYLERVERTVPSINVSGDNIVIKVNNASEEEDLNKFLNE